MLTHSDFQHEPFLLENIQGGIVYSDFDPPFRLRYATEGMATLCGYSIEELLDLVQMDLVHEDDQPALLTDVGRQFTLGDTFAVEYRLKRKDGTYVYVLDRAKVVTHESGQKYIHCLLTDISDLKEMEQALRLNQEKYKIAMQQSGNVILEYSPASGVLAFSENYQQLFGCAAPVGTLAEIARSGWADEEYTQTLLDLFNETLRTATTCSAELLIHAGNKRHLWCSLFLVPVIDNGNLYSIVGCLENIDEAKNKIEHLTELSLKDSLTGVYNRYAMKQFIEPQVAQLSDGMHSALLILDIDCFKQINDQNGHDYGDQVLIDLTRAVTKLLPPTALFGRLGGDEFLIFVTFETDHADLDALVKGVVDGVRTHFAHHTAPVTISIGAAWHTTRCSSFQALYRNADLALYQTKHGTKNGYSIYSEELS